ncbi:MAG TPA: glycosyltransferase [Pyrinomonadaceae bacterium]|nr:glycosyltransferase [Pyrinomonadaceae bacterium]
MTVKNGSGSISAIIPTIGRADSLRRLLESLSVQSRRVDEVIVADASGNDETRKLLDESQWSRSGLNISREVVEAPNAVRQREAAIRIARGEFLLFLDDDVVLEPECVAHMVDLLKINPDVVGVTADFDNQPWSEPTTVWRWYLHYVLRLRKSDWQGRVVGPLLRFGYNPVPKAPARMEWLTTASSLVRLSAYHEAGGFSNFFLHRCTINEDVDLGLKLSRIGKILFCPAARMSHYHAPAGRVTTMLAAEDDLFNRFFILRDTLGRSGARAFGLVTLYFAIETTSSFLGCIRRLNFRDFFPRLKGRLRALGRISSPIS